MMVKGQYASGDYYRMSVEALRNDSRLADGLGPPIRSLFLNLGDAKNRLSPNEAEVCLLLVYLSFPKLEQHEIKNFMSYTQY